MCVSGSVDADSRLLRFTRPFLARGNSEFPISDLHVTTQWGSFYINFRPLSHENTSLTTPRHRIRGYNPMKKETKQNKEIQSRVVFIAYCLKRAQIKNNPSYSSDAYESSLLSLREPERITQQRDEILSRLRAKRFSLSPFQRGKGRRGRERRDRS